MRNKMIISNQGCLRNFMLRISILILRTNLYIFLTDMILLIEGSNSSTFLPDRRCQHPGQFLNGKINPEKKNYLEGEVITFTCNQSFYIWGRHQLKCLQNNTWDAKSPFCEKNIAFGQTTRCLRTEAEFMKKRGDLIMITDGDINTCHEMFISKGEINLSSFFGRDYNVTFVDIYSKGISKASIRVEIIKGFSITGIKESYQCILASEQTIENLILVQRFRCNPSIGAKSGDGLRIRLETVENTALNLCEITSISHEDRQCGNPEKILQCHSIENYFQSAVEYRPMDLTSSYTKSAIRFCKKGKWQGEIPHCSDKRIQECGTPEYPANGRLSLSKYLYANGDNISIICNKGYFLEGAQNNTCKNGSWDKISRFCDQDLMYKHHLWSWHSDQESFLCIQELTDGNSSTCQLYHITQSISTLVVDLENIQSINALVLTMHTVQISTKNTNVKINIEIGNYSRSSINFVLCNSVIINSEKWTKTDFEILCSRRCIKGNKIRLHFVVDSIIPVYIKLCELQVVMKSEEQNYTKRFCRKIRNRPNCIVREMMDSSGNQHLFYFPKPNHHLVGSSERPCENGRWKSALPSCISRISSLLAPKEKKMQTFPAEKNIPIVIISITFITASILTTFTIVILTWNFYKKRLKRREELDRILSENGILRYNILCEVLTKTNTLVNSDTINESYDRIETLKTTKNILVRSY